MKVAIIDPFKIIEFIGIRRQSRSFTETGAFAYGVLYGEKIIIEDYCCFEKLGIRQERDRVYIPKKLSHFFLKSCAEGCYIPIHIHCHEKKARVENSLVFSMPDIKFMRSYSHYLNHFDNLNLCIFIVTDGDQIRLSLWKRGSENGSYANMFKKSDSYEYVTEQMQEELEDA